MNNHRGTHKVANDFSPRALLARRIEKRISQIALAKRLKVGQATVSRWESGKQRPPLAGLLAWCKALDFEPRSRWIR